MIQEPKIFAPGVYEISNDAYHSSAGISRSMLVDFKRSPKHFQHKYLNPHYVKPEPSTAMEFGTALHTALLEPQEFYNRIAVKPEEKIVIGKPLRLKDVGKERFEADKKRIENARVTKEAAEIAFELESKGKIILTAAEKKKLDAMCEAVYSDVYAKELLVGARYERSIFWIDPETQLLCKARPDIWHDQFIVDYKSCDDASEKAFWWAAKSGGYYLQFAMMNQAIKNVLGYDMRDFIFLAQEKAEPFLPAVFQLADESLDKGVQEFRELLTQLKDCMDKNQFSGYEPKYLTI